MIIFLSGTEMKHAASEEFSLITFLPLSPPPEGDSAQAQGEDSQWEIFSNSWRRSEMFFFRSILISYAKTKTKFLEKKKRTGSFLGGGATLNLIWCTTAE